jgi:hypothetical protein
MKVSAGVTSLQWKLKQKRTNTLIKIQRKPTTSKTLERESPRLDVFFLYIHKRAEGVAGSGFNCRRNPCSSIIREIYRRNNG